MEDEPTLVLSSRLGTPEENAPAFAPASLQALVTDPPPPPAPTPVENPWGAEFLEEESEEEDTSTDVIYREANPFDLSGLMERSDPPPSEPTPPPVPAWEVQIYGETLGPFTREEILDGLSEGAFPNDIRVRELPSREWRDVATLIVADGPEGGDGSGEAA